MPLVLSACSCDTFDGSSGNGRTDTRAEQNRKSIFSSACSYAWYALRAIFSPLCASMEFFMGSFVCWTRNLLCKSTVHIKHSNVDRGSIDEVKFLCTTNPNGVHRRRERRKARKYALAHQCKIAWNTSWMKWKSMVANGPRIWIAC